ISITRVKLERKGSNNFGKLQKKYQQVMMVEDPLHAGENVTRNVRVQTLDILRSEFDHAYQHAVRRDWTQLMEREGDDDNDDDGDANDDHIDTGHGGGWRWTTKGKKYIIVVTAISFHLSFFFSFCSIICYSKFEKKKTNVHTINTIAMPRDVRDNDQEDEVGSNGPHTPASSDNGIPCLYPFLFFFYFLFFLFVSKYYK
ncbi:hypothetical protein RFI_20329, partial [Reticulomyxa filosa]